MTNELFGADIKRYVLAGNATFTLQNGAMDKHFTYKVRQDKRHKDLFLVHLLVGKDNERDYRYIGCYYSDTQHFVAAKPWNNQARHAWPPALRGIKYLLEQIDNLVKSCHVLHAGTCGRCGRTLTTPESIARGLGPSCYKETL